MDEAQASLIREELSLRWKRIQFLEAENATLKEENDHLDNVIQGLHHDLDVLRKLVEI